MVADADYDLPLQMAVTAAGRNDALLPGRCRRIWRCGAAGSAPPNGVLVIAAWGCDSRRNHEFAPRNGGVPAIHKRRSPGGKRNDGIYTAYGVPTCLGKVEWNTYALTRLRGSICTAVRLPAVRDWNGLRVTWPAAIRLGRIRAGHQALSRAHPSGAAPNGRQSTASAGAWI